MLKVLREDDHRGVRHAQALDDAPRAYGAFSVFSFSFSFQFFYTFGSNQIRKVKDDTAAAHTAPFAHSWLHPSPPKHTPLPFRI